jgi:uncharacterized protein (DUF58 family)
MVFVGLVTYGWARLSVKGVEVERLPGPERTQVGHVLEERFEVRNESRLPKGWIELRELSDLPYHEGTTVVGMPAYSNYVWKAQTLCQRRGRYLMGPLVLTSGDPFGLFQRQRVLGDRHAVMVYPATTELPNFVLASANLPGEGNVRRRTPYLTPSATTVRDYVHGDSLNRIHWPSTARQRRLMVKEFELDPVSDVWLVLDLQSKVQAGEGEESTEEYAIAAVASIAKWCLDHGRPVGLLAYGEQRHALPPIRGSMQLGRLLEALTLMKAQGTTPLAEVLRSESFFFGTQSTVLAVTPSTEPEWVDELRALERSGLQPSAVVLEAESFGSRANSELVLSSLGASRVPTYQLRKGMSLEQGLGSPHEAYILR